jgi:hypothetical protein
VYSPPAEEESADLAAQPADLDSPSAATLRATQPDTFAVSLIHAPFDAIRQPAETAVSADPAATALAPPARRGSLLGDFAVAALDPVPRAADRLGALGRFDGATRRDGDPPLRL